MRVVHPAAAGARKNNKQTRKGLLAGMAELADATDLKSVDHKSCGFEPRFQHFLKQSLLQGLLFYIN